MTGAEPDATGPLRRALPVALLIAFAALGVGAVIEPLLAVGSGDRTLGLGRDLALARVMVLPALAVTVLGWPLLLGRAAGGWNRWHRAALVALLPTLPALALAIWLTIRAGLAAGIAFEWLWLAPWFVTAVVLSAVAATYGAGAARCGPAPPQPRHWRRLPALTLLTFLTGFGLWSLALTLGALMGFDLTMASTVATPILSLVAVTALATTPLRRHVLGLAPTSRGGLVRAFATLLLWTLLSLLFLGAAVGGGWIGGREEAAVALLLVFAAGFTLAALALRHGPRHAAEAEVSDVFG